MLEHVRCKPERHMHSLGRKRKGGGYLERGVKFFPFLLASAGLSWHKTPILTGAHNPTSPSFLHRASNTGRTTQLGRASRTAPCISAEPHALEHQGKDTTSPEKKLKSPGYVRDFSQMIIPWQVYSWHWAVLLLCAGKSLQGDGSRAGLTYQP